MRDAVAAPLRLASAIALLAIVVVILHRTASDPRTGAVLAVAAQTMAGTREVCRTLGEAELAALPRHMRRPEVCETHPITYRLTVRIDGEPRLERTYRPAGIRGDRPITLDERLGVSAGAHAVSLRFAPEHADASGDLPAFTLEEEVRFEEGRIRIATLAGATGRFEIR